MSAAGSVCAVVAEGAGWPDKSRATRGAGLSAPIAVLAVLLLSACSKEPPLALSALDIAQNNRGVAMMGRFDYAGARDVFQAVVDRQPHWSDARVNLAIATLNRQERGDETRALALLSAVIARDPGHLRAQYVSGLLRLYLGETETAERHFRAVTTADPDDAYAAYYLGQVLIQLDRVEEAIAQYRRAMALDPYLRSAYYGAALALRRSGHTAEAEQLLADYQRFESNPRARLAEFKYTRMGPRAETVAIDHAEPAAVVPPSGPVFAPPVTSVSLAPPVAHSSMTTVDIDDDGDQDLFLTGGANDRASVLMIGDGGGYSVASHPLSAVTGVNAVAWADIDNDGLVDAYLCRDGANQHWRQTAPGDWTDITPQTMTGNGAHDCADVLLIDADHDGDLDIFVVNRDGPSELFNNNLDGTFRALAAEQGIAGRAGSTAAIAADIDNDRDLDLVVLKSRPPHEIYLNDRLWQYRALTGTVLQQTPVLAATAGDTDADGQLEFFAVHADRQVYRWTGIDGEIPAASLARVDDSGTPGIALDDFDGDGHPDVLHYAGNDWGIHAVTGARKLAGGSGGITAALPVFLDAATGPELLVLRRDGTLQRHPPGPGRYRFAAFAFSGKAELAESMRSNRDAIGTNVALRVDSRWTIATTLDRHSGPGQSRQPLSLGLGGAATADYVALTWPDGVYQTELDLPVGNLHNIVETQRQLSSCPVLFAWDGRQYSFVTDVLGVGGLGFFVEPGVAATPRPWEYLLLPAGTLAANDGELVFRLTEPMEELAYLDSVRLHIHDLPVGLSMSMDERMVVAGPPATGRALYYDRVLSPMRAFDQRGDDITADIAATDRRAADPGDLDRRFIGRLAQTSVITLDFAEPLDQRAGVPVLIADGWVEYPYSQTVFAAWQAQASFDAPTLEAFGRDGRWHTVYPQFGYPAGMPRSMALPLTDLPAGTMRLRLSSNLEIYWDRIAVAHTVTADPAQVSLAPARARQRLTGFPRRTTAAQRLPHYDYTRRDPFWDTRYTRGAYSAFGPVTELVQHTDDAVAIIGPGEEIEFAFPAPAAAADGLVRHYVLELRGWAKDMDLYTRDGETVGPLPVRAGNLADHAQRDALHRRYHTRYQSGR